jgi:uroporphyrin-3 C-methyltransferase
MSDEINAPSPEPTPPRRRLRLLWPIVVVLAVLAGYGWYRFGPPDKPPGDPATPATTPALDESARMRAELAALHSRLEDAAAVNRSLREQVLGLTQRVGLVEDGLGGLERGAAPGLDALRLAEADYLLRLGEERLSLFGDVAAARTAFDLADQQLAQAADPGVTSVRQTLALERDALAGIASADLPVLLARLDALATQVSHWKMQTAADGAVPASAEPPGWWARVGNSLDGYFRVRRVDPTEKLRGGPLLRERLALDFARARMLLVRGEGAAALRTIEGLRRDIAANFDTREPELVRALAVLDGMRAAPLAPTLPTLGESRRELARLRDTVSGRPALQREDATPATDVPLSASDPSTQPTDPLPAEAAPPPATPETDGALPAPDSVVTPTDPVPATAPGTDPGL